MSVPRRKKDTANQDFDSRGLEKPGKQKEKMTRHSFMMNGDDYQTLKAHFESRGLSIGAGIREQLYQYMDRENLR